MLLSGASHGLKTAVTVARKKVLIITYYWPPSGGAGVQRWVKFCKYLPDFGIEPIVLTVENPTYPLLDETLTKDVSPELEVYRSKSIEPYSVFGKLTGKSKKEVSTPSTAFSTEGGLIQKAGVWIRANFFIPDARIGWIKNASSKAKQIIENYDIETVITTGPPNSTHISGTKIKEWNPDLKWIMDMRDPWSKIFYNETLPRTALAQNIDEHLEQKALSKADEVIVVSRHMAKLQDKIYRRDYQVLPNGFDHEDFPKVQYKHSNSKFTIKYVGSMTEPAIPHAFFRAISSLGDSEKAKLDLQFFGSYNYQVHHTIEEEYKIKYLVNFNGYIPHKEAKIEMQNADLLLLVIPKSKHNKLILTGKLFDYIGAQKPILYIGPKDGDAAKIIKDYGLGECFDYSEVDTLKIYLRKMMAKKTGTIQTDNENLRDHPYSRYSLTRQLSRIINPEGE